MNAKKELQTKAVTVTEDTYDRIRWINYTTKETYGEIVRKGIKLLQAKIIAELDKGVNDARENP